MTKHRQKPNAGFTIVELLVVIGVIALLLSLLSSGLSAAGRKSRQTRSLSDLKQVGLAWISYANTYDDRCLPGAIDPGTQTAWRVRYKDKSGNQIAQANAVMYPWRLLPFMDYSFPLLVDYLEIDLPDWNDGNPTGHQAIVAQQPAFGYNAIYLGGWWTTQPNGASQMRYGSGGYLTNNNVMVRGGLVCNAISQISHPDAMITFASSFAAAPGLYKEQEEHMVGAPWVVPHRVAKTLIWEASDGAQFQSIQASLDTDTRFSAGATARAFDLSISDMAAQLLGGSSIRTGGNAAISVYEADAVPLRRISNFVQLLHADGNTNVSMINDLMDQRKWINAAYRGNFDSELFEHEDTVTQGTNGTVTGN
ncbi:MAG: prepilin-type N-terminal cleavage/methylation domain-containing protein [Phycisphaerales bacterium]|nr:prepilin-type N-terminal cleavage/methylation domain-containing protein [Phycisphaerales bacterium]